MWNSFFLLFFIYFLSLLLTVLVLGLGNLVPLQYAIFFFIVKEDVMVFLFLLWQWNSTTVDLTLELQDQI
jgi:hypothetical protein